MEKKITAMLKFIKCVNEFEHTLPLELQGKALECLSMEKEQIISAHNDGALMAYALPFNAPFKKGEEYYNETYGKI
jgi:hypothetical protein